MGERSRCLPCQPNTFQPVDGQGSCKACDHSCPAGQEHTPCGGSDGGRCISCAAGQHKSVDAVSTSTCQNCAAGRFANGEGAKVCAPCDGETEYQPQPGQSLCLTATTCLETEYETKPPTATSDRICSAHTPCATTEWESKPAGQSSDRVCTPHTTCKPRHDGAGAQHLILSEYVEGSSYTKAVELFNPTTSSITMDGVRLQWHHNGKVYDSTKNYDIELDGETIAAGSTFTLCRAALHSGSNLVPHQVCDRTISYNSPASHAILHNGDDAVELIVHGKVIDTIGTAGTDPGSCWKDASGKCMTKDKTIRRKYEVTRGSSA